MNQGAALGGGLATQYQGESRCFVPAMRPSGALPTPHVENGLLYVRGAATYRSLKYLVYSSSSDCQLRYEVQRQPLQIEAIHSSPLPLYYLSLIHI